MKKQWQEYENLNANFHKQFGTKLIKKQHKGRRVDKLFNFSHKINQNLIYLWEILVVGLFSFSTLIFGNGTTLVNNTELVYPVDEISTLECRTQEWSTLSWACKIKLPIIENADYAKYRANSLYTDTYTVLFGGNYMSGWDNTKGSHYGIDLASAKWTPLYSIAQGKVYYAGPQAGYGNVVKIQFIYKGKQYFATYGHMDQILVQTGQPLTKGQKIWTIWNSGSTMGGLWGYHVHFEINNGDYGRPVYAFGQCSEAKKSWIETINQGLCRDEMFKYGFDPIAFLEAADATLPFAVLEQKEALHDVAPLPPTTTGTVETPVVIPELPTPTPEVKPTPHQASLLSFDTSKLDAVGTAFFDEWNVVLTWDLLAPMKVWETRTVKLLIHHKKTGAPFDGILKQPIILVASNTSISLDPVAISLVKNGEVQIQVKGFQVGTTYTAVNLWVNKIWGLNINVY